MKTKMMMIILAAGLGIAGCSASKEGQSSADSMKEDSVMAVPVDSTKADTAKVDSTRQDTTRKPPM